MPYVRVTLNGTMADGVERWSTGWAYTSVDAPVNTPGLFAILLDWADRCAAFLEADTTPFATLLGVLGGSADITEVNVAQRLDDGSLQMGATHILDEPIPGTGTSDNPLSTAVVVTTQTGMPGGSYRGRIFWPAPAVTIDGSGRLNLTQQTGIAEGMAALITGFGAAGGDASPTDVIQALVWSKRLGAGNLIRAVSVGDVPDVMRRRRDALAESRVTVAVSTEPM